MSDTRREVLSGWGRANFARQRVYRPTTWDEVDCAIRDAWNRGLTVAHRGAGQSYGDAALNQGGAVVVTTGLDRIHSFDPDKGLIRVGAGVTIDQLWRWIIPEGWWPPVVPGTSRPTVAGCAAMNIHGKNHYQSGAFGEHIEALTVRMPSGAVRRFTRPGDCVELQAQLGTQGAAGTILAVTLRLKRVESGYLQVEARSAGDLGETMDLVRLFSERFEYAVAWIDCFAAGDNLGRGEVHGAAHPDSNHDRAGEALDPASQEPPPRAMGIVPRNWISRFLPALVNNPGLRGLNEAKYRYGLLKHPSRYIQPLASFHFLLDYVPDWEQAYGPRGLTQYQFFVPEEDARATFRRALDLQRQFDLPSYLGVVKRHRRSPVGDGYSVDGFSLALDFPIRPNRQKSMTELFREFDRVQEHVGGRVYAAKDAVSRLGAVPNKADHRFESNLTRRWRS